MFITRNKLNRIIHDGVWDAIRRHEKQTKVDEAYKKWDAFKKSEKVGFLVSYQNLEWEVIEEVWLEPEVPQDQFGGTIIVGCRKCIITLKIGVQTQQLSLGDRPLPIDFVYENEGLYKK